MIEKTRLLRLAGKSFRYDDALLTRKWCNTLSSSSRLIVIYNVVRLTETPIERKKIKVFLITFCHLHSYTRCLQFMFGRYAWIWRESETWSSDGASEVPEKRFYCPTTAIYGDWCQDVIRCYCWGLTKACCQLTSLTLNCASGMSSFERWQSLQCTAMQKISEKAGARCATSVNHSHLLQWEAEKN